MLSARCGRLTVSEPRAQTGSGGGRDEAAPRVRQEIPSWLIMRSSPADTRWTSWTAAAGKSTWPDSTAVLQYCSTGQLLHVNVLLVPPQLWIQLYNHQLKPQLTHGSKNTHSSTVSPCIRMPGEQVIGFQYAPCLCNAGNITAHHTKLWGLILIDMNHSRRRAAEYRINTDTQCRWDHCSL